MLLQKSLAIDDGIHLKRCRCSRSRHCTLTYPWFLCGPLFVVLSRLCRALIRCGVSRLTPVHAKYSVESRPSHVGCCLRAVHQHRAARDPLGRLAIGSHIHWVIGPFSHLQIRPWILAHFSHLSRPPVPGGSITSGRCLSILSRSLFVLVPVFLFFFVCVCVWVCGVRCLRDTLGRLQHLASHNDFSHAVPLLRLLAACRDARSRLVQVLSKA